MNEWTVVTVLVAVAGLFITVGKPIVGLNNIITRLSHNVERLEAQLTELSQRNTDSHRRLWARSDEHGQQLEEHEKRLRRLEQD